MESRIELAPGRWAHASGALWLEEARTLIVADAHLGYGWAQQRRGQLGPVGDGGIVDKLMAVVGEFAAGEILFLGDTVHAPNPGLAEREMVEGVLRELTARARVRIVEGNHDRAFRRDFGHLHCDIDRYWRRGELLALHGDRLHLELPEAGHYVMGHVHPAVGLRDHAGARRKVPAFLSGERATLLPAFSPFAAGLDVGVERLPEEVAELLGRYRIYPATGRRIAELPRSSWHETLQ
jgi:putative SbcD/Mre11-related phosphoesterase